MKKLYKHNDTKINSELNKVYSNLRTVESESRKQRSVVNVKDFPSNSTMEENKLYINDSFQIRIKRNGVVKELSLTEV